MLAINASEVRKDWSSVLDSVIRTRPAFTKRTRDYMVLCSVDMVQQLVKDTPISATMYAEEDGSITLSLDGVDIAVCEPDLPSAKRALVHDLVEYAEEYDLYSRSPNRKDYLPLVMKALTAKSERLAAFCSPQCRYDIGLNFLFANDSSTPIC